MTLTGSLQAQDDSPSWEGRWIAEGTLFQIQVSVSDNKLRVSQVESLGFIWSSSVGEIKGNIARVPIEYAGVSGIVQAQLFGDGTAVVHAASCTPEFMVVCALAKNRQAVFRKISDGD